MKKHYLVLGNGPLGLWAAAALLADRDAIVSIGSRGGRPSWIPAVLENESGRVQWPKVDAKNSDDLHKLAIEKAAIIHCINPAYYAWEHELPKIYDSILKVAVELKIRLVTSENLYMYTVTKGAPVTESSALGPVSKKGGYRLKELEKMQALSRAGKLEFSSIHASDYYGPGATWQSHFGTRFFEPLSKSKNPQFVGNISTKHSFAYSVDFGRALAHLATTDDLSLMGRGWILEPSVSKPTSDFASDLIKAGVKAKIFPDRGNVKLGVLPLGLLKFMGLINKTIKELPEMLYQWDGDFVSSGAEFIRKTGFKLTPYEETLEQTIQFFQENLAKK